MPQVKHKEMKLLPSLVMATFATSLCFTTASAQQTETKSNLTASEQQRKELSMTYGITEKQAGFVQKFSHIRTLQIDSLSNLNLTAQEFRKERDKVTDKYYLQIYSILTAEQQKLFNAEAFKAARSGEVTSLNLPPMKAIEMGKIKAGYINSIQELEKQQLSAREFKFRKSLLTNNIALTYTIFLEMRNFLSGSIIRSPRTSDDSKMYLDSLTNNTRNTLN